MVCTYCGGKTHVINSRHQLKSNQVWRRRQCRSCTATFTSQETVYYALAWVVHAHGDLKPFSRDKLFLSLYVACEHRKTALSDAQGLTETVINKLPKHIMKDTDGTLFYDDIARLAHVALTRFDRAAAIRYYSLHQDLFPVS